MEPTTEERIMNKSQAVVVHLKGGRVAVYQDGRRVGARFGTSYQEWAKAEAVAEEINTLV
jgi:hypothetical protein